MSDFICAHCGDPVSNRGTTAEDGKRFCSTKRECLSAKRRLRRQQQLGEPVMERRPCSRCEAYIPPRPARATDSVLGRWCPYDTACQRHRKAVFGYHQHKMTAILKAPKVKCPACGLPDAREGFSHLNGNPQPGTPIMCTETGDDPPDFLILQTLWPDLFAPVWAKAMQSLEP